MIPNATTSEQCPAQRAFRAVVFDLDDTLYPEQQYTLSGFRAVSRYIHTVFGLNIYDDLLSLYMAGERTNVFGRALERHFKTVDDRIVRNVAHVFWAHRPKIQLFSDAGVAISLLSRKGIRTAVITVGQSAIQRQKVSALGLETLTDCVIHTDDLLGPVEPGQTCPDAFAIAALQLDVNPEEMLYVGDNPLTDFLVPKRLGISTIRVLRRHGEHAAATPPSDDYAPDITLPSLVMLIESMDPSLWTPAAKKG